MRGTVVSLAFLGMALGAPVTIGDPQGGDGGIIIIGDPWTTGPVPSGPDTGDCDRQIFKKTGFCIISGGIKPSNKKERRDGGFSLPGDKDSKLKEAIRKAELELEKLQAKDDKTPADWERIEALKSFIKKTAGVISISPPDGGSTILVPGKKRGVLEERDDPTGTPASSDQPCLIDLKKHAKQLEAFLLSFPPSQRASVWAQLIQSICGIHTGPIIPDPTTPGSPITPDPISGGDPLTPGKL